MILQTALSGSSLLSSCSAYRLNPLLFSKRRRAIGLSSFRFSRLRLRLFAGVFHFQCMAVLYLLFYSNFIMFSSMTRIKVSLFTSLCMLALTSIWLQSLSIGFELATYDFLETRNCSRAFYVLNCLFAEILE